MLACGTYTTSSRHDIVAQRNEEASGRLRSERTQFTCKTYERSSTLCRPGQTCIDTKLDREEQ